MWHKLLNYLAGMAEWQTHGTQNPARATSWGFDPLFRHHENFISQSLAFLQKQNNFKRNFLFSKMQAFWRVKKLNENLVFFIGAVFFLSLRFDFEVKGLLSIFPHPLKQLDKNDFLWYINVIHKECARDSPYDHTAT